MAIRYGSQGTRWYPEWAIPKPSSGLPAFHPFLPTPNVIPPGMYDPALDANLAAAGRGFGDTVQAAAQGNQRDLVDYGLGQDAINLGFGRSSADLGVSRQGEDLRVRYGLEDLDRARGREGEDYARGVATLQRGYGRLANTQRQQESAYGVLRGGAALQAASKRAANQAWDRQPLDQAHTRAGEDFATAEQRLREGHSLAEQGFDTSGSRLGEDRDLSLGRLALAAGRSSEDRITGVDQAARELGFSAIDTQSAKGFSAAQAGYNPPQAPANEHYNPITGQTTRTVTRGNIVYVIGPNGEILSQRRKG